MPDYINPPDYIQPPDAQGYIAPPDAVASAPQKPSMQVPEAVKAIGNLSLPNLATDRKSTRLNSSHIPLSRMPSSA